VIARNDPNGSLSTEIMATRIMKDLGSLFRRIVIAIIGIGTLIFSANAQTPDGSTTPAPSELTSRGIIANAAKEAYSLAIDGCWQRDQGAVTKSGEFLNCLRQQALVEVKALEATFFAARLKSSPQERLQLEASQSAWGQWRETDCLFARTIAPIERADLFYYDCFLRLTIERRVELKSLVGD
jgi:uncharacterized protein YecT (DUF1311 family)